MKKYQLIVSKEQLELISDACELSSRLRLGQFHELEDIIMDEFCNELKTDINHLTGYINALKSFIGLTDGGSRGIRQSSDITKKLYEIFYMIKQEFADSNSFNVYGYGLNRVTDDDLIIIKKYDE